MGFRFRRSIRLARGLRINLSKSGASLSVGGRGATVNLSKRGTRTTVGIPGTGLSWCERLQAGRARRRSAAIGCIILIGLAAIVIAALGH